MKFIPILFSSPMVKAILEKRKTQTRRLNGLDFVNESPNDWELLEFLATDDNERPVAVFRNGLDGVTIKCPYGDVGDVLWVRESFRKYFHVDENGYTKFDDERIDFAADNPDPIYLMDGDGFHEVNKKGEEMFVPWKPSIHMPKSACRIFLKKTATRVERLQDITEADAIAEGVLYYGEESNDYKNYEYDDVYGDDLGLLTAKESFRSLWVKINSKESWEKNPWVWVNTFERIERPEGFL